ncbi:MAG: methionyl-tRNA formyltransferase [Rickettsiales bacterium]
MKIIFMGTSDFAVPALCKIHSQTNHQIIQVYTQPPSKSGRGMKTSLSPVHKKAKDLDLEVSTPARLSPENELEKLKALQPDLIVVAAYGLILRKTVLNIPKHGCLNIHPSTLPRWRGAAPIERTIEAGDKTTSVCVMKMDEGLDTGNLLKCKSIPLSKTVKASELAHETSNIGANLLIEIIDKIDSIKEFRQSEAGVTYAKKIEKHEGKIDWLLSAEEIYNKMRAFDVWPNCWFEYKGNNIKILDAEFTEQNSQYGPGTIINNQLHIQTKKGIFIPKKLQKAGKKPMYLQDFLNGFRIIPGQKI